jgi:localization factor PodJL
MTLGEWLNRVILEDEAAVEAEPAFARGGGRAYPEAPWPRLVAQASGFAEPARVAEALERLTDRLETAETRTGLAVSGVEHAVRQAVARIDAAERESLAVATRVDAAMEQAGAEQAKLAERLRRMESDAAGPRSSEALRAIEQAANRTAGEVVDLEARLARAETRAGADPEALAEEVLERVGRRLAEAEGRTSQALDSLRDTVGALDARLAGLEGEGGAHEQRLEALARRLSEQVEAARIQFAERLKHADAGRIDQRFAELSREVKTSERRSAQAIQEMGRQVLALADSFNRRLDTSEVRSAEAISHVGGEMARVAEAMESRLGRAEQAQAEALQRLSDELGKISDRLSERLMVSERRAADAIEDVGQQVARVTERMAESQSRSAQDLADRIRESEERTALLLGETRERLERRLGEPEAAPESEPGPAAVAELPPPSAVAFGPELFSRAEEAAEGEEEDLELAEAAAPALGFTNRFAAPQDFAPIPEPEEDLFGLDQPEPPPEAEVGPQLSTREVIEQARAAARAAAPAEAGSQPSRSATNRVRYSTGGFFGIRPRRGSGSTLQTAIMVAGGAAFLSVGAAGVVLMQRQPGHAPAAVMEPPARAAVALAPQSLGGADGVDAETQPTVAETAPAAAPAPEAAPSADALGAAFASASRDVEAGRPGALAKLKAVADAGHAPAQFYLSKLYESGGHGVKQDYAQARAWTLKAAEGGDPAAMHNLALFEFRGEGGRQDLVAAARWFKAAAEQGIVDSQYNLGLLYQSGSGVPRDLTQAFAWFTIAAAGGDAQARAIAQKLKAQLNANQAADAQRVIAAYSPRAPAAAPSPAPEFAAAATGVPSGAVTAAAAERILGRLGYYKGPATGAHTARLRVALSAYQRDQHLPVTGVLDSRTAGRLAAFTQ